MSKHEVGKTKLEKEIDIKKRRKNNTKTEIQKVGRSSSAKERMWEKKTSSYERGRREREN